MAEERILVVDDEPGVRTALQAILTDEEFRVQCVESGEQGLELAGVEVPEAFEAHAREACACALAMQVRVRRHAEEIERSSGVRIEVRIGLHAGEVMALRVGSGSDKGWDASGPAVPLAARM